MEISLSVFDFVNFSLLVLLISHQYLKLLSIALRSEHLGGLVVQGLPLLAHIVCHRDSLRLFNRLSLVITVEVDCLG